MADRRDERSQENREEAVHGWQVRAALVQLWWVPLVVIACVVLLVRSLI